MSASANIGIMSVLGIYRSTSCRRDPTIVSSVLGTAGSAGGTGILLSTLSGLNRNSLYIAKPALIFFSVNVLTLARLKREVKCCLLIVFTPPYSS
jgi:hypothetical protein